ncbi:hypothetical protein HOC01_06115 [archaeon]|jgi:2'-5' RNA ligase|nr:hypothetical protein [archaeon]MBT6697582.1 hypothetical protein [archaeon]
MAKYALTLKLPEIILDGTNSLVKNIVQETNSQEITDYPVHLPIKYGFIIEDQDQEKIQKFLNAFNDNMSEISIQISGLRHNEKIFHLKVEKNNLLKQLQTTLQNSLKKEFNLTTDQFNHTELKEDYEFHLSLAKSDIDQSKIDLIKPILKQKEEQHEFNFTFTTSKITAIVKQENKFVYLR